MNDENELRIIRRAYAKQILAKADVADIVLENAFAEVRREDFLPPGPWPIFRPSGTYVDTPSADPVFLYTDDLVGILPERRINNGQPSLHAKLLAMAGIRASEHVVHVGAGAGYYTAIMAELVGRDGRVTAVEFDLDLSVTAARNLANRANVRVIQGDGSIVAFEPADVIYVNAGATRPSNNWLDRLKVAGRLMLPLTTDKGFSTDFAEIHRQGGIFRITRARDGFFASWVSPVAIYPCEGMRDEVAERALAAAFERGGFERVTRLFRDDEVPDQRCWLRGPGWCLAYE